MITEGQNNLETPT